MLKKFLKVLTDDGEIARDKQRLLSLALILTSIFLAWIPHERTATIFWFWNLTRTDLGFMPDLKAGLVGLLIVLPLYVRNILKWRVTSIYSILSFAFNLTLVATLCKIILPGGVTAPLWTSGLVTAVALSWLGVRPAAALAWVAVFALAIMSLEFRNYTLGIHGYLFILFGFLGIVLHSEMSLSEMLEELKLGFRGFLSEVHADSTSPEIR